MADRIFVNRRFHIEEGKYRLDDALNIPYDEYQLLTEQEIDQMKQQRFDEYKAVIDAPYIEPEISEEEQLKQVSFQLEELERVKAEVEKKKKELEEHSNEDVIEDIEV